MKNEPAKYSVMTVRKLGDNLVGYNHVKIKDSNELQQRNIQIFFFPFFFHITWAEARNIQFEIGMFKRSIGIVLSRHY